MGERLMQSDCKFQQFSTRFKQLSNNFYREAMQSVMAVHIFPCNRSAYRTSGFSWTFKFFIYITTLFPLECEVEFQKDNLPWKRKMLGSIVKS